MAERKVEASDNAADGQAVSRKNGRVAMTASLVAVGMLGMAYAAVPLYQIFCQVTGFGGTTQRAEKASDTVIEKTILVRFDANVSGDLGWKFKPLERTVKLKLGENKLAFYTAENISDRPLSGTASFNVAPEAAGAYFNKVECFCFTEQTLKAGEKVEMPVSFYIDPEILKDRSARGISQITLSYTFFPSGQERAEAKTEQTKSGS